MLSGKDDDALRLLKDKSEKYWNKWDCYFQETFPYVCFMLCADLTVALVALNKLDI